MSQFSARQVPWMKVGTVIDIPNVTAEEAIQLGGLDFSVTTRPAGWYDEESDTWHNVGGRVAIVRDDTDEVYNYATTEYHPIQYSEAFSFIDAISPRFVAAGALKGGRQGFVVAELPEHYDINLELRGKEDPHKLYVVMRTSQDLSRGIEIMLTTLRGKCMNQLTLPSLRKGVAQMWAIRHTPNVRVRMEQAQNVITAADHYINAFKSIASQLSDIDIDWPDGERLLKYVLPDKPSRDAQIESIHGAWLDDETNGHWGNAWGLTQAVDEYFEWRRPDRGRTDESRFTDGLDGSAHKFTGHMAQLLLKRR